MGVGICIPIISLLAFGGVKVYQYRYDNLKGGEHASKNRFNVNENNVVPMFGSNSIGEILIYSNDGDIHAVKDEPDLVYKKMKSRDKSSVLKKMSKMSRSELHKSDVVVAPVEVDGDGYFMRKAYGVTLAAIDPQVIEQNQNTILRQLIVGMKDISEVGGYKPMVEHGGNVFFDASNK